MYIRLKSLLALMLVLVLTTPLFAQVGGGGIGGGDVTIIGGDEDSLRMLLQRTIGSFGHGSPATTVYLDSLPEDFSVAFPLVDDINVLASIQRFDPYIESTYLDIYLQSEKSPTEIIMAYLETLPGEGWRYVDRGNVGPVGFVQTPMNNASFCADDGSASINLFITGDPALTTQLNANVAVPGDDYLCNQAGTAFAPGPPPNDPFSVLPPLISPSNVTVLTTGIAGGGPPERNAIMSTVILTTANTLESIGKAYGEQIANAGWEQTGDSATQELFTTTWTMLGETDIVWNAQLTIFPNPIIEDEYTAIMSIVQAPE